MLRHRHLSGLIAFIFLLLPSVSYAQLVGGEVFLQGDYVEVGMSNNGAFGTDQDAPAGYHPRGGPTRPNKLGFVADPDKDGWAVGTPNYIGDFFVPGSPQEGWDMLVGTNWAQAWSAASFSGGLTGTCTGYISTTTSMTGVWEGTLGDLKITQSTKLKKDKLYFTSVVKIVNKGTSTLYNFYYDRTVDPDNEKEVPPAAGSTYDTKNKIVYALPSAGNKTLVTAVGTRYSSYLGLGSRDCRAKPYVVLGGLTPTDTLDKLYSGTGTTNARFTVGEETTADVGIGIVFKIDSLRPGDSTVLSYAYVLSEKDLDSAFEDLKPVLNINGKAYLATDTIKACVGSVLNIDVINADYYNWSWSPSTGISPTRGARVSITVGTSEITYTADPSSTMCPIDPLKLTIVPIPNPAAPAAPSPLFYCQHEVAPPMTGSPAPGGSLRWYTTSAGGTPVMSLSPVTNIVGTRSYYVSQVSAQGCESERTEVVVNTRPLPVLDGFSSKSPTACAAKDGTISFRVDGANSTYTIFFDKDGAAGTPVVFTSDATGRFTLTGMGGGSYTYFYVVDKNGCKSLPYIGPVDLIDPIPDGPPIVNNGPLCVGGKLELTAPFLDGVTYKWTGPNGFSSTDRSPELEDVTEASGGDYVLIVTKGTCVYRASRTTLEIAPTPKHQQFTPKALCEGTDLKVELLREPGTSYAWTGHGVSQFDQDLLVSPVSLSHSGYYLMTATSGVGCITLDSVEVRVDKKQTVSYGSDTSICSGDYAQLFVQTDGAGVLWSPAGSLDNATALNPKASPTTKTEYQVVAHSGTTCPDITGKVNVDVIPAPSVRAYDTLVRMDVPYTIMPVYGQDAVKWHWEPADNLSCSDCPNPVFTSRNDMTYTVYVSNNLGCTSADTVTIRVFCDGASVTMPNAFTPNGDGKNDLYYVRGKGFAVKRFIIYNRLGQEVFHKENFLPNDKNYGWDGTLSGTQITEAAGFVYMLEVQCYGSTNEPMVMKGTVLLIR